MELASSLESNGCSAAREDRIGGRRETPMTVAGCEGIGISGSNASSERNGSSRRRHIGRCGKMSRRTHYNIGERNGLLSVGWAVCAACAEFSKFHKFQPLQTSRELTEI
jgi:hypothetical protein